MASEPVHCPTCDGTDVVKHGKTSDGKQRFRCQNPQCESVTFIRTSLVCSGSVTRGQASDYRYESQWQWDSRYCQGPPH